MLIRLAARNMVRSIRNYLAYFLTVLIVVILMYSFTALVLSEDIMELSENMSAFRGSVIILTLFVSVIMAFVISYASDFIVSQRKKEFAVYRVMGMEQKTINFMFCMESSMLFFCAMLSGIVLGTAFSGNLIDYVMGVFDTPHKYGVNLSVVSIICTAIFCLLMQMISTLRIVRKINRQKIIDLMYDAQKNEQASIVHKAKQTGLFFLAIVLLPIGIWLIWYGLTCSSQMAWVYLGLALIFIMFSVLRIYRYFPMMLAAAVNKLGKWKFEGTNLFLLKQFVSRVNSAGKVMAVVAVLLTLAMCTIAGGLFMGASYKVNIEGYAPYDIAIKIDADIPDFEEELAYISDQVDITDYVDYKLYESEEIPDLPVLAVSDYNHIRKQLSLAPVDIRESEYLVHCEEIYKREALNQIKEQPLISISSHELVPFKEAVYTEILEQYWMAGDHGYAIVVPDSVAYGLPTQKSRLIVSTVPKAPKEMNRELEHVVSMHLEPFILEGILSEYTTIGVMVKTWTAANSLTGYTIISFCCLYLGVVFTILVGALLAFQQMAAVSRNRRSYTMLHKMGVASKEISKLAFREMLLFFAVPVIMPLIITFLLAGVLNNILKEQIMALNLILKYTGFAVMIFMVIYSFYFVITYITYKKLALVYSKK